MSPEVLKVLQAHLCPLWHLSSLILHRYYQLQLSKQFCWWFTSSKESSSLSFMCAVSAEVRGIKHNKNYFKVSRYRSQFYTFTCRVAFTATTHVLPTLRIKRSLQSSDAVNSAPFTSTKFIRSLLKWKLDTTRFWKVLIPTALRIFPEISYTHYSIETKA